MTPPDAEPRATIIDFGSKERFSSRVDAYARYRPSYPQAVVDSLMRKFPSVSASSLSVADVGSGTGIFARLLLDNGLTVYGIEPNTSMRKRAEETLSSYRGFWSVGGEATHTALPDHSVDVVTAAQAFHWFAVPGAVREFSRVLKYSGLVLLVWNDRRTSVDKFHEEYEALLLRYCPEYADVNHRNVTLQSICDLFVGWKISIEHFENDQHVSFAGLKGRLDSSSYCPAPDHSDYRPLMDGLFDLFNRFNRNGEIVLRQDCTVYFAHRPR